MTYQIELTRAAVKALRRLPETTRRRVERAIAGLADDPRPRGCLARSGREATWRIRIGDHRVVYEIHDQRLVVTIIRVAHRRDVYR